MSENMVQSGGVKYCTYCKVFNSIEEELEEIENFIGFSNGGPLIDEGYTWNNEYSCKDWHLYKVFVHECKKCGSVYFESGRRFQ
jgi:hypothetical protein